RAPAFAISFGSGRGAGFHGHAGAGVARPGALLGTPYFYPDSFYTAEPAAPANPAVVYLQAPAAPEPTKEEPKPHPLMIELQGDRYVRVGETTAQVQNSASSPNSAQTTRTLASTTVPPLPAAVLVYRNGQRE